MKFVGMKSIPKENPGSHKFTDWVATEKIHGSSYQFFTDDGQTVGSASRRYVLNQTGSFLKCPTKDFRLKHEDMVRRVYQKLMTEDKWAPYREEEEKKDEDDDEVDEEVEDGEEREADVDAALAADISARLCPENGESDDTKGNDEEDNADDGKGVEAAAAVPNIQEDVRREGKEEETNDEIDQRRPETRAAATPVELRIYGELYGGGGVEKDIKPAVQKEIIYADDFRFYAFAISVNRRWLNLTEMNEMCEHAGFPYFARPVSEPKATVNELKEFLTESGFMRSKSQFTDRQDNHKTFIEGVVMSPLTRPGFGLPVIKFLAPSFNDVRMVVKPGKVQRPNYCTKARYLSVISKLDDHERQNLETVTDLFIADILKESGETELSGNKTKAYAKLVKMWLAKDGYIEPLTDREATQVGMKKRGNAERRESAQGAKEVEEKCENENDEDDGLMGGLFE